MKRYWIYMLECCNGSLYTGITHNLPQRFKMHQAGKGAKYTRMYPPKRIAQSWKIPGGRSQALKLEAFIKRMTRSEKWALIRSPHKLHMTILHVIFIVFTTIMANNL